MSASFLFAISTVVHFCQAGQDAKSANRQREVETYTTVLLDDEAFSLVSVDKKLQKHISRLPSKEKERISPKTKGGGVRPPESKHFPEGTLSGKTAKGSPGDRHSGRQSGKAVRHRKRSDSPKKLKKRNFDGQKGYAWNPADSGLGYESGNADVRLATPPTWPVGPKGTENTSGARSEQTSEKPPKGVVARNSEESLWAYRSVGRPQTDTVSNFGTLNESASKMGGDPWQDYPQPVNLTTRWPPYDASPAAVVIRNPPTTPRRNSETEKEKLEEQLRSDEDDTSVSFGCLCDQTANGTCWMTREVGDVVTLAVRIESSKTPDSFQVRWLRVYHAYDSRKGRPLEIRAGKLPWNMVSGSEGRELRLNPVTDVDIDPNCIVAKVFLLTKQRGRVLFTHLKKLVFRIDIPLIDMGHLYAGEEVSIHLENFISLPEKGDLLLDWSLERGPHEALPLPSNVKVSHSGRTAIVKELKEGSLGVISCVVYSSSRYSVAKRRFDLIHVAENVKRRSTSEHPGGERWNSKRNVRCRRLIRRSREKALQRLGEGAKPKSRKKRFKRKGPEADDVECEPMRKKIYSRWIRSLFGDYTTTDPRLMPLDKLFELSEEGDGTLDDIIPHEVHYVESEIRVVNGTAGERSIGQGRPRLNCTSDAHCGQHAICVPQQDDNGHCFCRPEFFGDGLTCRKIPFSNHREKRLRRDARKDFAVPEHLFYEPVRRSTPPTTEKQAEDNTDAPPKILAFEEEESFLLGECIDDRDCSVHAHCVQPTNGHPYCRCRPGYRGNGLSCWEIVDYVPPEENVLPDPRGPTASLDRLPSRTATPEELDEIY